MERSLLKSKTGAIDQGTTIVFDRCAHAASKVSLFAAYGGRDRSRVQAGLPLSTHFSSLKRRGILKNVPGAKQNADGGELLFGDFGTFLLWNLRGGPVGGIHVKDTSTNTTRTQSLNLQTLEWEQKLLGALDTPRAMLPEVRSSSEVYDQAAALAITGGKTAGRSTSATWTKALTLSVDSIET